MLGVPELVAVVWLAAAATDIKWLAIYRDVRFGCECPEERAVAPSQVSRTEVAVGLRRERALDQPVREPETIGGLEQSRFRVLSVDEPVVLLRDRGGCREQRYTSENHHVRAALRARAALLKSVLVAMGCAVRDDGAWAETNNGTR